MAKALAKLSQTTTEVWPIAGGALLLVVDDGSDHGATVTLTATTRLPVATASQALEALTVALQAASRAVVLS